MSRVPGIFVTVGTQLPFDRLLGAMDAWAADHPGTPVLAQTGASAPGTRPYRHLSCVARLDQAEFTRHCAEARLIVAHAGMGTILQALDLGKPVIIMPRLPELGEHRNGHQVDTAVKMAELPNVAVVQGALGLHAAIEAILYAPERRITPLRAPFGAIGSGNQDLVGRLRQFIFHEVRP